MRANTSYFFGFIQAPKLTITFVLVAMTAIVTNNAVAATITLVGDNVTYSFDDSSLFGTANIVGDSLFFLPTDFSGESSGVSAGALVTETLNIDISVNAGSSFILDSVGVVENGDAVLRGAGASVSASLRTQVTSLTTTDGGYPLSLPLTNIELVQTGELTSFPNNSTNDWALSNTNDFAWEGETHIILQLQNNLIVDTDFPDDFAFMQKKFGGVGIVINPTPVPLPAAAWFFGSALFGLCAIARRKIATT